MVLVSQSRPAGETYSSKDPGALRAATDTTYSNTDGGVRVGDEFHLMATVRTRPALFARPVVLMAGLILGGLILMVGIARFVSAGTPLRDAAVAILLLLPVGLYFALVRPLVFPYGLYILLMPFDVFLGVSHAGTITKMLGGVACVALLFYCLRTRRLASSTPALRVVLLLLVWMMMSLLWTVAPEVTWQWIPTYLGLALLYLAISLTPVTITEFRFILWAIVAAFLASAIIGVVLFRAHAPVTPSLHPDSARVVLTLGNLTIDPNEYADALIFPFAIASMLALGSRYLSVKLLGFGAASLMVAAVFVSASREAVIGLALVALYYLWRSRHRVQVFAMLLVTAIAAGPFSATLLARIQHATATGGAGRTSIWAVGITAIKHYGLFGSGMGTFPVVYDQFYLSIPQIHSYGWSAPPHNVLLQFFVELGIVGLALYAWFIAANFTMLRTITPDHPLYDYRLIVEGGLIAVSATSLFIGSFNEKWVWLVFATAGQLVFLASTYQRAKPRPVTPV